MRNLFRALSLLGLACLVAACQTTQGQGELKLTPAVAQYFEKYLLEENPTDFYVAADSSYALYTYCRDHSCSAADNGAWNLCQQNSAPAPCAKLTNKNEILWINAGNFMPYKSELVKKRYGSYFYDPNSPYKTSASTNKSKSSSALKIHPPIEKQEINNIRYSGKIKFSQKAADHFVTFLSSETSKEFYVSEDGKTSYTSICSGNYGCLDYESVLAIRRCNQKSQTSPCHLFSNNHFILWKNAGDFMPYKAEAVMKRFNTYYSQ